MPVSRRTFIARLLALSGASVLGTRMRLPAATAQTGTAAPTLPADWPGPDAWEALRRAVGERLIEVASPLAPCQVDVSGKACVRRLEDLRNPFFIQDQPGGTQTNGWLDAWTAAISPRAVAAESAADIAAAVNFAREHGVRLVVKGAGHDYLGRSNAPDSLLVWTHRMREITFHETFRITGAPESEPGVPALTVGAGARWLEAYHAASAHGRYVQGGGCTSVGAAGGFIQGGGYGSYSKRYGTGAGSVLEYEVVTADGEVRIANALTNSDLFWALRGGGGGTFGIVSKATLLAHEPPQTFGFARGKLTATNDDAFRDLLARFVAFYPDALDNPTWGEQIVLHPDNSLEIFMTYLDLTYEEAHATWQPLLSQLYGQPDRFAYELRFDTRPFDGAWSLDFWKESEPRFVRPDERPDAPPGLFWWTPNQAEVSQFLNSYQSRWLPIDRFAPDAAPQLVETLFSASRHASLRIQINKGLSGAAPEALERDRATSIHPAVFDAAAIVIVASGQRLKYPGLPGHEPDLEAGREAAAEVDAAMKILREAFPGSGTYANECDYFEPDWQRALYGAHYERLLAIKRRYDPGNLFRVHHGVGSED